MTDESKEKTEPWVEKHGAKYPYAYDKGGKLFNALKCRGYPSAVLVSPDWTVVWAGHPASLQESTIEQHIGGASRTPVGINAIARTWPKEAAPVKKALLKKDYAKALDAALKVSGQSPEGQQVVDTVRQLITSNVEGVLSLKEKGDYLHFTQRAKELARSLDGLEEGEKLEALLDEVKKDKQAQKCIKGQKALARVSKMLGKVRKKKDLDPLIAQCEKLADKYDGTYAGEQARSTAEDLRGQKDKMRR